MLLINGMPVIHIELKKSGIPVSQAYNQIEKYAHEIRKITLSASLELAINWADLKLVIVLPEPVVCQI